MTAPRLNRPSKPVPKLDAQAVLMVTCCSCPTELLGPSNPPIVLRALRSRPVVAGYRAGRPYCEPCYAATAPKA